MANNELIGERIKQLREEKGITQEELAKSLGMNKSTIQRYETAKIDKIKLPVIDAIASKLNVAPEWLTGKDEIRTEYYSAWDKEAEEFEKAFQADSEWLKKYLSERFSDEDVSTAYELIEQLPKFNKDGLIKIIERMDELSELKKYLNQIDLVE